MKLRSNSIALALACAVGLAAASQARAQSIPINIDTATNDFAGSFTITKFTNVGNQLVAIGTLVGTVTDAAGDVVQTVNQILALPVTTTQVTGDCEILHLELGPLDVNLLGLTIHLDKVVLDISAQSGSGKLLGNLLCAVSRLLDRGGTLDQLVRTLNRILGALG